MIKFAKKHRNVILRLFDIVIIVVSYYLSAIIIENKLILGSEMNKNVLISIILAILVYGSILQIFRTYKNITRYENGNDYLIYVLACLISCTIMIFFNVLNILPTVNERTNLIASLIIVTAIIGYRVFLRMILNENHEIKLKNDNRKNVLIIGAGEATKILLSTIKSSMKDAYNVIGLIDDNTNKVNYAISGNKILGTRYDIPRICKENKVELIFFTISNISNEDRKKILEICQETGCKVRILPGTKELIKDKPIMQSFRNVEIEDLLRKRSNKIR